MRAFRRAFSGISISIDVLVLGLLLAATSLTGCAPDTAARQEGLSAGARGGTLRMIREAPRSLDPLTSDSVYESLPVNQIFDTLVDLDDALNLRPALAESWTIKRDGSAFSFTLRGDVRFHDGRELTAEDVVFTVLRNLRPGDAERSLAFSSLLCIEGAAEYAAGRRADVPGLRAVDERTVRILIERPHPAFLEVLAMDALAVVPAHVVREVGDAAFARAPVGTGPFRMGEWTDQRLTLLANGDYFRGRPRLDAVEIRFLDEDETDFGARLFLERKLDLLEPATESLPRLAVEPRVRLHRYQELSISFLGLNGNVPPLDRLWLRRAIAHAIDRDAMIGESPEVRRAAMGILPPGIPGYSPDVKGLEYDPDEARRILAEAGHPGGEGLPPVRICNPSMGPAAQRVLERITADLGAVGIRVEVLPVSWAELGRMLDDRSAPAFLLAWVADRTDPDAFLRELFETNGSANYFAYSSETVDELLDRGVSERDPQRRAHVYRQAEREILVDAPLIPLYHTVGILAVHDGVRGLEPTPLGLAKAELEKVWFEEEGSAR